MLILYLRTVFAELEIGQQIQTQYPCGFAENLWICGDFQRVRQVYAIMWCVYVIHTSAHSDLYTLSLNLFWLNIYNKFTNSQIAPWQPAWNRHSWICWWICWFGSPQIHLRELGHIATTDDVLVAVGAAATHWASIEPKDGYAWVTWCLAWAWALRGPAGCAEWQTKWHELVALDWLGHCARWYEMSTHDVAPMLGLWGVIGARKKGAGLAPLPLITSRRQVCERSLLALHGR